MASSSNPGTARDSTNSTETTTQNKQWDTCIQNAVKSFGVGVMTGAVISSLLGCDLPLLWGTGIGLAWSVKKCKEFFRYEISVPKSSKLSEEDCCTKLKQLEEKLESANKKRTAREITSNLCRVKPCNDSDQDAEIERLLEGDQPAKSDAADIEKRYVEAIVKEPAILYSADKEPTRMEPSHLKSVDKEPTRMEPTKSERVRVTPIKKDRAKVEGEDKCHSKIIDRENGSLVMTNFKNSPSYVFSNKPRTQHSFADVEKPLLQTAKETTTPYVRSASKEPRIIHEYFLMKPINSSFEDVPDKKTGKQDENKLRKQRNATRSGLDLEKEEEEKDEQLSDMLKDKSQSIQDDEDESTDELDVIPDDDEEDLSYKTTIRLPPNDTSSNSAKMVIVESTKTENWPFAFSLPSLDKFQKRPTSSFKWPPLPSSIIIRPQSGPPKCTCDDSKKSKVEQLCACGSTKHNCKCT